METEIARSILISVICVLVVTGVIEVMKWVWLKPKSLEKLLKEQGFSGTSYKLLFGDFKEFTSMRTQALKTPMNDFSHDYFQRAEPFRHQLITKFGGSDYFFWFGPTPMVHISKPDLINEVFTRTDVFVKAKMNPILDKLLPGVVSYEGEKWVKHRRIINPVFHVEKLKLILPEIHNSCAEMFSKWDLIVAENGSSEVDVWPDLMKVTGDVISRAAFGSSYEEGQRVFELLKEQIHLTLVLMQSVHIPGFSYLPTATKRRFKYVEDEIHSLLRALINKRYKEIEFREVAKPDLLVTLLHSNSTMIKQTVGDNKNQQVGMSLQEVIDECKLFYLAGQETTSILLVWTLILLSKHQDWQARAREEVLQTFGDNVPDFEGLSHLKTVTMILHEVLRLYPPVLQVARTIYKDTNLGAFSLPSGAMITLAMHSVHRDKELWGDDAHEFKPERFAEGISKATKGNNAFFPFGWGPRICIGEKFAMIEAKTVLSMILKHYSFELSTSYVHAPVNVFFLQPQYGAQIILHKL